jgi:hypothetical protein
MCCLSSMFKGALRSQQNDSVRKTVASIVTSERNPTVKDARMCNTGTLWWSKGLLFILIDETWTPITSTTNVVVERDQITHEVPSKKRKTARWKIECSDGRFFETPSVPSNSHHILALKSDLKNIQYPLQYPRMQIDELKCNVIHCVQLSLQNIATRRLKSVDIQTEIVKSKKVVADHGVFQNFVCTMASMKRVDTPYLHTITGKCDNLHSNHLQVVEITGGKCALDRINSKYMVTDDGRFGKLAADQLSLGSIGAFSVAGVRIQVRLCCEDVFGKNVEVDLVKAKKVSAENVSMDMCTTSKLNAKNIQSETLVCTHTKMKELEVDRVTMKDMKSNSAAITEMAGTSATFLKIHGKKSKLESLESNSFKVDDMICESAKMGKLVVNTLDVPSLNVEDVQLGHLKSRHVETDTLKSTNCHTNEMTCSNVLNVKSVISSDVKVGKICSTSLQSRDLEAVNVTMSALDATRLTSNIVQINALDVNERVSLPSSVTLDNSLCISTPFRVETLTNDVVVMEYDATKKQMNLPDIVTKGVECAKVCANEVSVEHVVANSVQADVISAVKLDLPGLITGSVITDDVECSKAVIGGHVFECDHITTNGLAITNVGRNEIKLVSGCAFSDNNGSFMKVDENDVRFHRPVKFEQSMSIEGLETKSLCAGGGRCLKIDFKQKCVLNALGHVLPIALKETSHIQGLCEPFVPTTTLAKQLQVIVQSGQFSMKMDALFLGDVTLFQCGNAAMQIRLDPSTLNVTLWWNDKSLFELDIALGSRIQLEFTWTHGQVQIKMDNSVNASVDVKVNDIMLWNYSKSVLKCVTIRQTTDNTQIDLGGDTTVHGNLFVGGTMQLCGPMSPDFLNRFGGVDHINWHSALDKGSWCVTGNEIAPGGLKLYIQISSNCKFTAFVEVSGKRIVCILPDARSGIVALPTLSPFRFHFVVESEMLVQIITRYQYY